MRFGGDEFGGDLPDEVDRRTVEESTVLKQVIEEKFYLDDSFAGIIVRDGGEMGHPICSISNCKLEAKSTTGISTWLLKSYSSPSSDMLSPARLCTSCTSANRAAN